MPGLPPESERGKQEAREIAPCSTHTTQQEFHRQTAETSIRGPEIRAAGTDVRRSQVGLVGLHVDMGNLSQNPNL